MSIGLGTSPDKIILGLLRDLSGSGIGVANMMAFV
jgi:hypothetical protein